MVNIFSDIVVDSFRLERSAEDEKKVLLGWKRLAAREGEGESGSGARARARPGPTPEAHAPGQGDPGILEGVLGSSSARVLTIRR